MKRISQEDFVGYVVRQTERLWYEKPVDQGLVGIHAYLLTEFGTSISVISCEDYDSAEKCEEFVAVTLPSAILQTSAFSVAFIVHTVEPSPAASPFASLEEVLLLDFAGPKLEAHVADFSTTRVISWDPQQDTLGEATHSSSASSLIEEARLAVVANVCALN